MTKYKLVPVKPTPEMAAVFKRFQIGRCEWNVMLAAAPEVQAEPVAWMFQHEETGLTECVDIQQVEWGFEKNNPRWQKIGPLYTHPQTIDKSAAIRIATVLGWGPKKEWVGLTGHEQKALMSMNVRDAVFKAEEMLKEKNA